MVWRFRFEDNMEIVGLGEGKPFGPWNSKEEALGDLDAEFGFAEPSDGCYVLVEEPE